MMLPSLPLEISCRSEKQQITSSQNQNLKLKSNSDYSTKHGLCRRHLFSSKTLAKRSNNVGKTSEIWLSNNMFDHLATSQNITHQTLFAYGKQYGSSIRQVLLVKQCFATWPNDQTCLWRKSLKCLSNNVWFFGQSLSAFINLIILIQNSSWKFGHNY